MSDCSHTYFRHGQCSECGEMAAYLFKNAERELTRLRAENEELRKALYNLCRATDLWNDAIQSIIGRQANTGMNGPLGEAKDLLAKCGVIPTVEKVQAIYRAAELLKKQL